MTDNLTFLGFDLSTQQIKVVVINSQLQPLKCYSVSFDEDLPWYGTKHGVYSKPEENRIVAPVEMWLEALDMVFSRMKQDSFPFHTVAGVSGSCQQHGSVYWSKEATNLLNCLDNADSLKEGLFPKAFSHGHSPNWQDHSTIEECKQFDAQAGGKQKLAELTGSKAYHRFTGPQIKKFIKDYPDKYENTSKITLVSNFLSSVLLGQFARIDQADACGMNLYDIKKAQWDEDLLKLVDSNVENLKQKIDAQVEPVGYNSIGVISPYFVKQYGFAKNCKIYSFTGDNLATILALPLLKNDLLVSLGTSTTLLLITDSFKPNENYHVMIHPTNPNLFMNMICYSNGALPRNTVKDSVNLKYHVEKDSWSKFNEILDSDEYQAAYDGNIGVYFPQGEIIPNVDEPIIAKYKFDTTSGTLLSQVQNDYENPEINVKGIIESQALSCRIRIHELLKTESSSGESIPRKLFFVGGSSKNQSIISKFSQILGNKYQETFQGKGNFKSLEPNSCALGGAYKANWSFYRESNKENNQKYEDYLENIFDWGNLQEFSVQYKWSEYKIPELALRHLEELL